MHYCWTELNDPDHASQTASNTSRKATEFVSQCNNSLEVTVDSLPTANEANIFTGVCLFTGGWRVSLVPGPFQRDRVYLGEGV